MLLAFTLAIEEFGVPAALGSRAGVVMLTVGIEKSWPTGRWISWRRAIVAAADGGGVVRLVAAKAAGGEKEVTSITGEAGENHGASLGWMTLPAVLAMAAVGGLAVGVPAVSMMLTSVMGTLSGGVSVENVTLRHFAALFDQQGRCPVGPRHQPVASPGFGANRRRAGPAGHRLAGDGAED